MKKTIIIISLLVFAFSAQASEVDPFLGRVVKGLSAGSESDPVVGAIDGIVKSDGDGNIAAATADDMTEGSTNKIMTATQETNWDDAYSRTSGFFLKTGLTGGGAGDLDGIDGTSISVGNTAIVSERLQVDSGTTDGTTASKLVDSSQNFLTTVTVGDELHNTTDDTYTYVTAVDGDGTLSVADDIFISGEAYTITSKRVYLFHASNNSQSESSPSIIVPDSNPSDLNWDLDAYYLNGVFQISEIQSGVPVYDSFCVAISDESTALTTGTAKRTFRMPYAMTLDSDGLRASVSTAPTGSTIIIDINEGGSTIMTTNKLSIDATEETSTTAATAAGITDTAIADDAEITIDIDQIGSGTAGAGAKVCFRGNRSW